MPWRERSPITFCKPRYPFSGIGFELVLSTWYLVQSASYASAALAFTSDRLPLVARAAPSRTVRLDRTLVERVVAPAQLEGPIARGRRLGQVRVYAGGKLVADVPLVAARAVPAVGFRQKLSWYAGRTVDEAGGMLKSLVAAVLP